MGRLLYQAGCVLIGGRALLIEGPAGSGKSSLALALIDRGAQLVGDDGVTLEQRGSRLWASPPPNITGLLEIRNVGLIRLPVGKDPDSGVSGTGGPAALVLRLDEAAPRLPDAPDSLILCGCAIPLLLLHPASPVLHLRAEKALELHGLA